MSITLIYVLFLAASTPVMSQVGYQFSSGYPVTFESLYNSGKTAYKHQRWFECYDYMTKAIEEFKVYKNIVIECKLECHRKNPIFNSEDAHLELEFYTMAMGKSYCFENCLLENLSNYPNANELLLNEEIREIFDILLTPYDYLQICAYKLEKVQEAVAAAYTFALANPDHLDMQNNIHLYQQMPQVKDEYFINMEKKLFQVYFEKAQQLYIEENYDATTVAVEDSLEEFYREVERCDAMCEVCGGHHEAQQAQGTDIYTLISDYWIKILECRLRCVPQLTRINGEESPDFLPELYNYLQFSHYRAGGDLSKAAAAAESYLVLSPDSEIMLNNKQYYMNTEMVPAEEFVADPAAVRFKDRSDKLKELQEYVTSQDLKRQRRSSPPLTLLGPERDESHDPALHNSVESNEINNNAQDFNNNAQEINNNARDAPKPAERRKGDPELDEEASKISIQPKVNPTNARALAALGHRDEVFLTSLDNYLEEHKLQIHSEELELKGKTRVVVDNMLTEQQCNTLIDLVQVGGSQSDGYSGNEHRSSPHTDYEKFEGVTIAKAAELVSTKTVPSKTSELYLKSAEKAREFLETYYNLKKGSLYFHYTHLVCRSALDDQVGRRDGSHPLHADNCVMQIDKSCIRARPAYIERDFSALLYLNGDFEGGDFFFADREHNIETTVRPWCGRMVGFEAGTYHGVNAVTRGTRCALAMWFTLEENSREVAHTRAWELLRQLNTIKPLENPSLEEFIKSRGYDLVMTETELNGPERFVSDQVASQNQCQDILKLANEGGVVGDGYSNKKNKSSPHTNFEEFKGLSVAKAAELAATDEVDWQAVKLYLQLSEDARLMVEKYFNLPQTLYFDYTHLVCRTALDDSKTDRVDLSHPVHSDNCFIRPNGECVRQRPAYIHRDYSAVLYLNDDFVGGDFFFAHKNLTEQAILRPKCGRLVGFNAGNYHGVKAVLSGQRCAIALWFTLDPHHKEAAHTIAWNILKKVEEEKNADSHGGEL